MATPQAEHDVLVARPWSLEERWGPMHLGLLVAAILVLDYTAGRGFSLHIFYLVPTGLAAWSFGARAGVAVGLVAAAYWAFVGYSTRQPEAAAGALAWEVGSIIALFLVFAFIVARHRAFVDQLLESARIDQASGALSRREFQRLFETEVRRARRYRRPLALAVFDVTDAKDFGKRGPEFLPGVVRAVQTQLRDSDSIARIDVRRLAVILVECASPEALSVLTRLRENVPGTIRMAAPAMGLVTYAGGGPSGAAELVLAATAQLAAAQATNGVSEQKVL